MNKNQTTLIIVILALTCFLGGCLNSNNPIDPKDLAKVGDGCLALSEEGSKKDCIEAISRIAGVKVEDLPLPKQHELGQAKETITFRGVNFDKPAETENILKLCREDKKNLPHVDYGIPYENRCVIKDNFAYFNVSYGTLTSDMNVAVFVFATDGSLLSVSMNPQAAYVPQLMELIKGKYGEAKTERDKVQNKLGASFDREIYTWQDSLGNRIVLNSRFDKIDQGHLEFLSSKQVAVADSKRQKKMETAKSSL